MNKTHIKLLTILLLLIPIRIFSQGIGKNTSKSSGLTARDVIELIKKNVKCPWAEQTVDTFKAGDPDAQVTGIACTFMATKEVLKLAVANNCNLIITHEPIFYNHLDETVQFGDDPVIKAKKKYIEVAKRYNQ